MSFDILWCPHQDHYQPFDCRVQRYFVQGMIDAASDFRGGGFDFQVRFDSTIPAGSKTCHFTIWRGEPGEVDTWARTTAELERKAIEISRRECTGRSARETSTPPRLSTENSS